MEKHNNGLVKAAIKSLMPGLVITVVNYFFFDDNGFVQNPFISGSIMTVILFIILLYEEKKKSQL